MSEMFRVSEILIILLLLIPVVWALSDILRTPTSVWADSDQNQGCGRFLCSSFRSLAPSSTW